jgi:hypothetical protein
MAQSDQVVQNATFPSVRADINDNLAALYSQSSGNSAPSVTVAFQPWVDTSSSPPVWKIRNSSNTAWITVGVLDPAGFNAGGITQIVNGGTGATTATAALTALLPSQSSNTGKALITNGTLASWGVVAAGASIQILTGNATYTPTSGKTTFLVILTGGGGGSAGSAGQTSVGGGGGAGTAIRLYNSTDMGANASVVIGASGSGGGSGGNGGTGGTSTFTPSGSGGSISATGGGGSIASTGQGGSAGNGSGSSNLNLEGQQGTWTTARTGGASFWGGGYGRGGNAPLTTNTTGGAGVQGVCFVLEW